VNRKCSRLSDRFEGKQKCDRPFEADCGVDKWPNSINSKCPLDKSIDRSREEREREKKSLFVRRKKAGNSLATENHRQKRSAIKSMHDAIKN
jgi:hypothetical protein